MILIDLIIAAVFVIIITAIICMIVDGATTESVLIGLIILIVAVQKLDTIRLVDTSPIISIAVSAFVISIIGVFLSRAIHKITH